MATVECRLLCGKSFLFRVSRDVDLSLEHSYEILLHSFEILLLDLFVYFCPYFIMGEFLFNAFILRD